MGWNEISITPPNELVEVKGENGNIAQAYPTYYPFKIGDNITGGKWGSEVIPCELYWDGGWMILSCDMTITNIGSIIQWRKL